MKTSSHISEEMVSLAHAFVETERLRSWFFALELLPVSVRRAAFAEMAAQMRTAGEDPGLSSAVAALARPKMYEAVLKAIR